MDKPARVQVNPSSLPDEKPPQTGNIFNVWYLQWSGGDGTKRFEKLNFKVNVKLDSGYTRANKHTNVSTICIYFAKGCCYKGKKCDYLHRLPNETDYYPPTQDIFGRDKTFGHRDDMDGVGALNKINDTLYIGGLHIDDNTESLISKHFGEFGKISKVKVLHNKSCAFLTYKHEFEAQFAKEAMQNQSLNDNEVLVVRWANDDPDPQSQAERKRKLEEMTVNTVKNLLKKQKPAAETEDLGEPEIEEPEESEEEVRTPKLIEATPMFNKDSLLILSKLKKSKVERPISDMLGYSSDED